MAISYMTKAGYDKKMQELANLENVERPAVVQAIVEAREKGDLSVRGCLRQRLLN